MNTVEGNEVKKIDYSNIWMEWVEDDNDNNNKEAKIRPKLDMSISAVWIACRQATTVLLMISWPS